MGNFKTWVEEHREDLKRCNQKQSAELIERLIQGLEDDHSVPENENKRKFLKQLILSTSIDQNESFKRLVNSLARPNNPMIKGLVFIMALWAVRVIFKKN